MFEVGKTNGTAMFFDRGEADHDVREAGRVFVGVREVLQQAGHDEGGVAGGRPWCEGGVAGGRP